MPTELNPMGGKKPAILSAGVIIVRYSDVGWRYLLLRVYDYWDFPKGVLEAGEDALTAAVRETKEETTLEDLSFRWGYEFRETPPYRTGKVARYYLAESRLGDVALPISEELGRPEHDEFQWLGYEDARELLAERVRHILDWANDRVRCEH
jgi:bis(5'-nucleosidyl)-tetraphosphatase